MGPLRFRGVHLARAAGIVVAALLAGCATDDDLQHVTVEIREAELGWSEAVDPSRVRVDVVDIRERPTQERTTIGDVSLGSIVFRPREAELVRRMVQAKAELVLAQHPVRDAPVQIWVGMREFQVVTPATMLYWDVTARVALVLRVQHQDRSAGGVATERTFVWPGRAMIERVTAKALQQTAKETETALRELLQ